jgi:hypothetical protein
VHVPGGVVGGGGRCLLRCRVEATAGAVAAEVVPGVGIPGARTTSGGGSGTRVDCGGLGKQGRLRGQRRRRRQGECRRRGPGARASGGAAAAALA